MHSKPLESPPEPIAAASTSPASLNSPAVVNPMEQHKLVDEKKQKRKRDDAPVRGGGDDGALGADDAEGADGGENPVPKECKVGLEGFLQPPEGGGACGFECHVKTHHQEFAQVCPKMPCLPGAERESLATRWSARTRQRSRCS